MSIKILKLIFCGESFVRAIGIGSNHSAPKIEIKPVNIFEASVRIKFCTASWEEQQNILGYLEAL
jgi:hypothetical protein